MFVNVGEFGFVPFFDGFSFNPLVFTSDVCCNA